MARTSGQGWWTWLGTSFLALSTFLAISLISGTFHLVLVGLAFACYVAFHWVTWGRHFPGGPPQEPRP